MIPCSWGGTEISLFLVMRKMLLDVSLVTKPILNVLECSDIDKGGPERFFG